jgi:quercetin dioxygenase-like cupin family protein
VVADDDGVHVVRAGDVASNPPNAWHWHRCHARRCSDTCNV